MCEEELIGKMQWCVGVRTDSRRMCVRGGTDWEDPMACRG